MQGVNRNKIKIAIAAAVESMEISTSKARSAFADLCDLLRDFGATSAADAAGTANRHWADIEDSDDDDQIPSSDEIEGARAASRAALKAARAAIKP